MASLPGKAALLPAEGMGDGRDPAQARRAALTSGQKVKRAQPWHRQQPRRVELGTLRGCGSQWEAVLLSWGRGDGTGMARFTHTLTTPGKPYSLFRRGGVLKCKKHRIKPGSARMITGVAVALLHKTLHLVV